MDGGLRRVAASRRVSVTYDLALNTASEYSGLLYKPSLHTNPNQMFANMTIKEYAIGYVRDTIRCEKQRIARMNKDTMREWPVMH